MAEDKILYGIKNVHVASITEAEGGAVTFGEPQKLAGATAISLEKQGEETKVYADNTVYYSIFSNNGYNGTLTVLNVPDWFKINYLGFTEDSNKNIVEKSTAKQKNFALLFEFEGDKNGKRYIFYNCSADRPNVEADTIEDTIEATKQELAFSAIPIGADNVIKAESQKGGTNESSNWATWFTTAPTLPTFGA